MCMIYKGVDYHYAFEFKVPTQNSGLDKVLHVVISNYREDTRDFSGLCLENELRVVSEKKMLFEAFFDIVDSITRITIECEAAYFEEHGVFPTPLLHVTEPDFLEKFEIYKQSKKSLEYYEQLKMAFERSQNPKSDICHGLLKSDTDSAKDNCNFLFDCHNIVYFNYMVIANQVPIRDTSFFRL